MPTVTFTSDFGLADPYVAAVKGVMLGICPTVQIVDVTHAIAPQAVQQAVFLTAQAWPFFAEGTIHLAVVDPGVGTSRRAIAVRGPHGHAVGPDNGVLSAFLREKARPSPAAPAGAASSAPVPAICVAVPEGYEVRAITNPAAMRSEVSATFHGRDLFGPAAAWLAAGFPFVEIGDAVDELLLLPPFRGVATPFGVIGSVVHVDRFGNLITTIHSSDLSAGPLVLEIGGLRAPFVRTYGEGSGLVALVGSSEYVEMAWVNGSAAAATGAAVGMEARVIDARAAQR